MPERTSGTGKFDAIIVGAGVGGLYAIHLLRKLGLKLRAFDFWDAGRLKEILRLAQTMVDEALGGASATGGTR